MRRRAEATGRRKARLCVVAADPATRRQIERAIDGKRPRAAVVVVTAALSTGELAKASGVVEIRAAAPGWTTVPHVRVDLADARARRLARASGVEVLIDAKGGVRRRAARRGIPAISFEGSARAAADVVLTLAGVTRTQPAMRAVVGAVTRVRAKKRGLVVPTTRSLVDEGEPLVEILDARGKTVHEVRARARSVVLATANEPRPGEWIARVGRVVKLSARRPPVRIGWCEWVALPDLDIPLLHAKIDTGARTSALHVANVKAAVSHAHVLEWVTVRDSGGHVEKRPLIETTLVIGDQRHRIRVTLTDRGDMRFPMLVGRTALAHHFVVDPTARDVLGRPRRKGGG